MLIHVIQLNIQDQANYQKAKELAQTYGVNLEFTFSDSSALFPLIEYYPNLWGLDFIALEPIARNCPESFVQFTHNGLQYGKNVVSFARMSPGNTQQLSQVSSGVPENHWNILHELAHSFCNYFGLEDFVHEEILKNNQMADKAYPAIIERLRPFVERKSMEFKFPLKRRIPVLPGGGFNAMRSYGLHKAQDYRYKYEVISAPADGIVKKKTSTRGGNMLDFVARDYRFEFAHLSKYLKIGQVGKGEAIAVSGNTGSSSTGPHCHLAIYYQNTAIDPLKFNFEGDDNMYSLSIIRNPKGEVSFVGKGVRRPVSAKVFQSFNLGGGDFWNVSDEVYNAIPVGEPLAGTQNLGSMDGSDEVVQ